MRNETKHETKRNESHTHKFTNSTQAHHSTRIIFSCAVWIAPDLDSVSEVRLMFSEYSLLWELSILLTVLESFSQYMLTVDIFSSYSLALVS